MAASTPIARGKDGINSIHLWEYWGSNPAPTTLEFLVGNRRINGLGRAEEAMNEAYDLLTLLEGSPQCAHRKPWREGCSLCHRIGMDFYLKQFTRRNSDPPPTTRKYRATRKSK